MAVNPLVRPLGIVASILATVQGLAWSVLALLGILIYSGVWTPEINNITSVSLYIYGLFLTYAETDYLKMRGQNFIIFIGIYFAFSLIWMIISLCHLWIVIREKWQYARNTLIAWAACTGLISVLDIITMAFFAVDYAYLRGLLDTENAMAFQAVSAAGIMMVISARGFVLLLANIFFTAMFAYWAFNFQDQDTRQPKREIINGYEQNRPTWLGNGNAGGLGRPYSNPGYEQEPRDRPQSYDRNRYAASPQSDNFARIGRSNLKSPSNPQPSYQPPPRERGPYIPEPDYSPTSLRKHPKSVLKSRNHY